MQLIKYLSAFVFIFLGWFSFSQEGILAFSLVLFSFGVIPFFELILPEAKDKNVVVNMFWYDLILYILVPLYLYSFYLFLSTIGEEQSTVSLVGRTLSMGLLCGIFGINMAHELGHRKSKFDQFLAQLLLLTSQYTHFFIEHNKGHHKRVGTPEDPATARKGESLYRFWFRVIPDAYRSALEIEKNRLSRIKEKTNLLNNAMVRYAILQLALIGLVWLSFGSFVTLLYLASALIGILLLETINYIEHYGLLRNKLNDLVYERVQDIHSWNSDHIIGRVMLFELTRHSHHHANSLIKYPELESRESASQLPTGYPGMMLLALIPPLWFKSMDKRLPSH